MGSSKPAKGHLHPSCPPCFSMMGEHWRQGSISREVAQAQQPETNARLQTDRLAALFFERDLRLHLDVDLTTLPWEVTRAMGWWWWWWWSSSSSSSCSWPVVAVATALKRRARSTEEEAHLVVCAELGPARPAPARWPVLLGQRLALDPARLRDKLQAPGHRDQAGAARSLAAAVRASVADRVEAHGLRIVDLEGAGRARGGGSGREGAGEGWAGAGGHRPTGGEGGTASPHLLGARGAGTPCAGSTRAVEQRR